MAADVSLPSVVLFLEGTSGREVFQKVVSGLQRGGRRVQVFVRASQSDALFRKSPRSSIEPGEEVGEFLPCPHPSSPE